MNISRRDTIKGATAAAGLFACEAVAPAVAAALVPTQDCGCPRIHDIKHGHTCTVHDKNGRRWDSYNAEEAFVEHYGRHDDIEIAESDWNCYCGRHGKDDIMDLGTKCRWEKTSYEYDEWECSCLESIRDEWLASVQTDWIQMAKESGFAD